LIGVTPVDSCTVHKVENNLVDDSGRVGEQNDRVRALHESLEWINVQATLIDICIAFYPLDLPPYVLLEIVDKFPLWQTHVNHKKKIDYIIQIKRFCDDLIHSRNITTTLN
jgi:hypothetical protein